MKIYNCRIKNFADLKTCLYYFVRLARNQQVVMQCTAAAANCPLCPPPIDAPGRYDFYPLNQHRHLKWEVSLFSHSHQNIRIKYWTDSYYCYVWFGKKQFVNMSICFSVIRPKSSIFGRFQSPYLKLLCNSILCHCYCLCQEKTISVIEKIPNIAYRFLF